MLRSGTLADLLDTNEQGERRILNILDLPMGGVRDHTPPQYKCVRSITASLTTYLLSLCRNLATNVIAWHATRGVRGILGHFHFPRDEMIWATASTRGATTWSHVDDHGLGTVVQIMTGYKYWVILRPKYDQGSPLVDMGSVDAFNNSSWNVNDICDSPWEYEGVLLGPGDTLCVYFHVLGMPPDQLGTGTCHQIRRILSLRSKIRSSMATISIQMRRHRLPFSELSTPSCCPP